jgi:hypothetical protein
LPEEHIWIVTKLAQYSRAFEIKREFLEEFGRPVPANQFARLCLLPNCNGDPEIARRNRVLQALPLFLAMRAQFNNAIADIPIANNVYRLKALDNLLGEALRNKNWGMAADLLQQADRSLGGKPAPRGDAVDQSTARRLALVGGTDSGERQSVVIDEIAARMAKMAAERGN